MDRTEFMELANRIASYSDEDWWEGRVPEDTPDLPALTEVSQAFELAQLRQRVAQPRRGGIWLTGHQELVLIGSRVFQVLRASLSMIAGWGPGVRGRCRKP